MILPRSLLLLCLACDRTVRQCRRRRKWLPLALFTASRQLYSGYKVDLLLGVSERTVRGRLGTVGNPLLAVAQQAQTSCHSSGALFTSHTPTHSQTWNWTPVWLHALWACPLGLVWILRHNKLIAKIHSICIIKCDSYDFTLIPKNHGLCQAEDSLFLLNNYH